MATILRPVVVWMLISADLFLLSGLADGVYPGGSNWPPSVGSGAPWIAYAFGLMEFVLALALLRGRDWAFFVGIGITTFFVVERPLAPLIVGYTTLPGYALHFATAIAQVLTLFAALRVFRVLHAYLEGRAAS